MTVFLARKHTSRSTFHCLCLCLCRCVVLHVSCPHAENVTCRRHDITPRDARRKQTMTKIIVTKNLGNLENWAVKDAISMQFEKESKASSQGPHCHILITNKGNFPSLGLLSNVSITDIISYKTCAVCIGYQSRQNIPYYNFFASLSICIRPTEGFVGY